MKRFALTLVLVGGVVLAASAAFADHLGIYSDNQGNSCVTGALVPPPTTNFAYVIHKFTTGTTGARFKVNDLSGLFHAAATTPYLEGGGGGAPYIGSSLAYGNCLNGQLVIYTLEFLWFAQPISCAKMEIVPDPIEISGNIIFTNCNFTTLVATGGQFFWNADGTCQNCNEPNATEITTWGTIKALYR
jgi:hypothetical protein